MTCPPQLPAPLQKNKQPGYPLEQIQLWHQKESSFPNCGQGPENNQVLLCKWMDFILVCVFNTMKHVSIGYLLGVYFHFFPYNPNTALGLPFN